jgi:hypothetical protein
MVVAYDKAPKDILVILNLANTYRSVGDKAVALRYYKLVLSSAPPEDMKSEAEAAISELNK